MLNLTTFLWHPSQLSYLIPTSIREVIFEHQALARLGTLSTKELLSLHQEARHLGFSTVLQWDILATETDLQQALTVLQELPLSEFSAIRVQDPGAGEWLKTHHPQTPIHLIVETGNHNLRALQGWERYFGSQLHRLILSTEIPGYLLTHYCEQLKVPCEILGVGRILLFYTPRQLIQPLNFSHHASEYYVNDEEQHHHAFPVIENRHGTFMFHNRDLFLLDVLPNFTQSRLSFLRLDLRFEIPFDWIQHMDQITQNWREESANTLKANWPHRTTHGFYRANRTERPIERLKNKYLKNHDEYLLAYVAESLKGEYIALISRKPFHIGDTLLCVTPEGRQIEISPASIRNTKGELREIADPPGLWLIPHHKYLTSQTLVYSIHAELNPLQDR